MGKTPNHLDKREKNTSVRDPFKKCVKKKRRKKDLDNLRKQVVQNKHAMQKNPTLIKARKTSFGKTLIDFAERRQANDDNIQLIGNVKKQDQKKICTKLLADPFIGLFKNGARGNEVNREQELFNETDRARFNGNVFRLLRSDDSKADKVAGGLHGKMTQTSPEYSKHSRNIRQSPILVNSLKNKRKYALIKGKKGEKSDEKPGLKRTLQRSDTNSTGKLKEVSGEDALENLLIKYQKKSENDILELRPKLVSRTVDEYKRKKDEREMRNQESDESIDYSLSDHELLSIEKCKQICDTVSQHIGSENCFMISEEDPLQRTRSSLKRLYSDTHRQYLLRNKVQFLERENLSTPNNVDSIEVQKFVNHLKEESQHKGRNEKSLFVSQFRSDDADDLNKVAERAKTEVEREKYRKETVLKAQQPFDAALFYNDFLSRYENVMTARNLPKECEVTFQTHHNNEQNSEHAPFILRRSNKSVKNIFKDAFRDIPQDSPINLSYIDKDVEKSPLQVPSSLGTPCDGEPIESEDLIKYPKTPKPKKASRNERPHLLKSKLNFMAAKSRQIQSRVTYSPPAKPFTIGNAEEKRKHVLRFQGLFAHVPPDHFSHNFQAPQTSHINKNIFLNQETTTSGQQQDFMFQQKRNSCDLNLQVRGDDQFKAQNKNTQPIHQQVSGDCRVILMQSEPKNYPENFEDVERHSRIQFYENPQRPLNCMPSFFSSKFQNLNCSHMQPKKSLTTKQASDLGIMNRIENLNLLTNTFGQTANFYNEKEGIIQSSSSNAQTHHEISQPIKFIAIESDQQVQGRVPIYFHEKKPYIAYFPSYNPNKNIAHNFCPHEYVEHANPQVMQTKPRVVSCLQCANTASGTIFCHQDLSTVPPVAHQRSFQASSQDVYNIDKVTIPEIKFIKSNNMQHGRNCGLTRVYMTGQDT